VNTVFVYGLLKPGFRLHHVVAPFVDRMAAASARGRLYVAGSSESGGLPAARFDEDGVVDGFVLWLDEARLNDALATLDDLEDEGSEYRRLVVEVHTADGPLDAYAYEYLEALDGRRPAGSSWR